MPENALINRLYHEQLEGEEFKEAKNQVKKIATFRLEEIIN